MFKAGLTTVSDAGIEVSDIDLINSLHESGDLSIRVVAMFSGTQPNLDQAFERGPFRTDRLTAEAIKFYMDGALGSRGAALLEPYSDRPDFQLPYAGLCIISRRPRSSRPRIPGMHSRYRRPCRPSNSRALQ